MAIFWWTWPYYNFIILIIWFIFCLLSDKSVSFKFVNMPLIVFYKYEVQAVCLIISINHFFCLLLILAFEWYLCCLCVHLVLEEHLLQLSPKLFVVLIIYFFQLTLFIFEYFLAFLKLFHSLSLKETLPIVLILLIFFFVSHCTLDSM